MAAITAPDQIAAVNAAITIINGLLPAAATLQDDALATAWTPIIETSQRRA